MHILLLYDIKIHGISRNIIEESLIFIEIIITLLIKFFKILSCEIEDNFIAIYLQLFFVLSSAFKTIEAVVNNCRIKIFE